MDTGGPGEAAPPYRLKDCLDSRVDGLLPNRGGAAEALKVLEGRVMQVAQVGSVHLRVAGELPEIVVNGGRI